MNEVESRVSLKKEKEGDYVNLVLNNRDGYIFEEVPGGPMRVPSGSIPEGVELTVRVKPQKLVGKKKTAYTHVKVQRIEVKQGENKSEIDCLNVGYEGWEIRLGDSIVARREALKQKFKEQLLVIKSQREQGQLQMEIPKSSYK